MAGWGNFKLHLVFYISAISIGILLCDTSKGSNLPRWGFVFGIGIFITLLAIVGLIVVIRGILKGDSY